MTVHANFKWKNNEIQIHRNMGVRDPEGAFTED